MHIISKNPIIEFSDRHPESKNSLDNWYRIMRRTNFETFVSLRLTFPSADIVGNLTIFNIGGNKVRLIAAIHYNRCKVYIRNILTHVEYDKYKWRI
jgi:mRNA interferase HigB